MRVFLLSPARCDGIRASLLLREGASFPLARALRTPRGAELGEVFSFASALYFRGKLAYARAFAARGDGRQGVLVIAPGRGLIAPETRVTLDDLQAMARVPVDEAVEAYARPLRRDVETLARVLPKRAEVVLLGSVASSKYTSLMLGAFGARLLFPKDFVGRGDMSRGGLLLRSARSGQELAYVPVEGTVLRGARPVRLPKLPRRPSSSAR